MFLRDSGFVQQYNLIKAEQELLNKTLKGSIKVMIDILSMVDQESFVQSLKIREFIRKLTSAKIISSTWEIEISALLSQIGQVTIPTSVTSKLNKKQELNEVEKGLVEKIPQIGHDLLKNIPRLDKIAKNVLYQNKRYNGEGFPNDEIKGQDIPLGARIIFILKSILEIEDEGISRGESSAILNDRKGYYDPMLLNVILGHIGPIKGELRIPKHKPDPVGINQLHIGQVLVESVETEAGQLLVMAGQVITESVLIRIKNWSKLYRIREPILVTKSANI